MPVVETLYLTSDRDHPRLSRGRAVRGNALVGVCLLAVVAGALATADDDTWGRVLGIQLIVMTVLAWSTLLVGTTAHRGGRLEVEQRPGALRLPGSSTLWRLLMALLVLSLLLPVVVLGSWLDRGSLEGSAYATVVSLVLLVLGVPVGVQVLRGRIRAPYLELDEDALTHHGMNASTTVRWQEISGLRLVADPGRRLVVESSGTPQRVARSATPGERQVGGPRVAAGELSLPVALLGSDAALVADLVEDLAGGPQEKAGVSAELRAGLATGATLELLRQRSTDRSR